MRGSHKSAKIRAQPPKSANPAAKAHFETASASFCWTPLQNRERQSLNPSTFRLALQDASAKQLTAIVSQRMMGVFDLPESFPDFRFDSASEADLGERTRVEARSAGTWQLTPNCALSEVNLTAEIHQYAPQALSEGTLAGMLRLGNRDFPATYPFPGPFQFCAEFPRVALEHLIGPLATDSAPFQWLPALFLRDASFAFAPHTGAFSLSGKSDEPWTLPVGRDGIPLHQVTLDLARESAETEASGQIEGIAILGGKEVRLAARVETPSVLLGRCKQFDLPATIQALCDDAPLDDLFATIQPLTEAEIQVNLADHSFTAEGSPPSAGSTRITAYRHDGRWGFVANPTMLRSWRLSDLAPFLRPLDHLDITKLAIVVTSFDRIPWDVSGLTHELTNKLRRGVNIVIPTRLAGAPELDLLARLYQTHQNQQTPQNSQNSQIQLTLAGTLNKRRLLLHANLPNLPIGGGLEFLRPRLTLIQPHDGPTEAHVTGPIRAQIGETALPFTARLKISGQHGVLTAKLSNPWDQPLGLNGTLVDRLNLAANLERKRPRGGSNSRQGYPSRSAGIGRGASA